MLNTVLSSRVIRVSRVGRVSRVSRVSAMVSVRFSGRYKNLGPPFIGLPKCVVIQVLLLLKTGSYSQKILV